MQDEMSKQACESPADEKPGGSAETKKRIIATVLVVILIGVLIVGPASQPEDAADAPAVSLPPAAATAEQTSDENTEDKVAELFPVRELSRLELESVFETRVFDSVLQRDDEADAGPLTVEAVYGASGRQSAIVGSRIVRSGQSLPDGRKVLDVSNDGVKLGR